jgi:two-component system OmpR family sensor kinase
MSLRARLMIGLVVVAAVGLVIAGLLTYTEERSYLVARTDQLFTRSAILGLEDQLDDELRLDHGGSAPKPGPSTPPGLFSEPPDQAGAGGPPGQGRHEPFQTLPPPGSYGVYVAPDGATSARELGGENASAPDVRTTIPLTSSLDHPELVTVNSLAGSALQYRVLKTASDTRRGHFIIAIPLSDLSQTLVRLRDVELIVIAAVLAALAACAWLLIRLGLRPLDRMGATAGAIAAGDYSRRVSPADNRTEVGRLGVALNAMLGQIEQAFAERRASEDRLRQFLSDASHELRTPLTSIRGYAELFRMGAAGRPEDLAKAMARIEEEAARMGVLVEDLLALARLDEMPVTRHDPVDLAPLVEDAADDARAGAPDRAITVSVRGAQIVAGDQSQLRQVLAILMRNAITHTPPGSPIELSLDGEGEHVRIAVRDHGPGLPAGAGDNVFDRFWRAEGGRERGRAGAGLGLAIVAAIVEAHGGRASAANASGGGARFVIELPALAARQAPAPA